MARIVDTDGRFRVGPYIARQSWISAFSEPTDPPSVPSKLSSKFQQRMIEEDFRSSLSERLAGEAGDVDAILVDLVDERYGIVPTRAGYVTNSYELRNSGWKKVVATGEVITFASPAHLELWTAAANRLIATFEALGVIDKVRLIDTKYAARTDNGEDFGSRALTPARRNAQFEPYYAHLRETNLNRIVMPDSVTIADSQHKWGVEPFHFVSGYYELMADMLESSL